MEETKSMAETKSVAETKSATEKNSIGGENINGCKAVLQALQAMFSGLQDSSPISMPVNFNPFCIDANAIDKVLDERNVENCSPDLLPLGNIVY